jgi:low temperature requirement protein LtrA
MMANEAQSAKPRPARHRLRTLDVVPGERHASWLELFFDLVFVLAVAKVAAVLAAETTLYGFLKYVGLFIPVWWAWVGYTFYADRFESDEPAYRILTFAAMLAVAALALRIGGAYTVEGSASFAIAYALVLLVLCAMYARTAIHVPLARKLARQFIVGLGISALIFLSSLLFDPPFRYRMWAIGVLTTLATPFLNVNLSRVIPIDQSHIPERFGLFTIIVLGEAVIATANGAAQVPWNFVSTLTASCGLAMAACIWWINFEFVEDNAVKQPALLPRFVYIYGHFFIVASIVAIGIGIEHAIKESNEAHLHLPTLLLLCIGITTYLAAITVIRVVSGVCSLVWVRLVAIAFCLAVTAAGMYLPPLLTIAGLLGVLIASVLLEAKYLEGVEDLETSPGLLPCEHEDQAIVFRPRSDEGCEECVKNNYKWVHLRLCLTCGHVGCCDSSRNKHATKHFQAEGHTLIASLEEDENWSWCYTDERFVPLAEPTGNYHPTKIELVEQEEV